jgi:hypothetical protein
MRGQWAGAPHATDVPFVFDTARAHYSAPLTDADEKVAQQMNTYWANFVKTGDPNGKGLPNWPAYQSARDMLMDFTNDGPVTKPDPWKKRLDLTEETRFKTGRQISSIFKWIKRPYGKSQVDKGEGQQMRTRLSVIALAIGVLFGFQTLAQTADPVFPKGDLSTVKNLTGEIWLNELNVGDSTFDPSIARATYGPGAKLDWHIHPGGQVLLITEGTGYYQERGKPVRIVHRDM